MCSDHVSSENLTVLRLHPIIKLIPLYERACLTRPGLTPTPSISEFSVKSWDVCTARIKPRCVLFTSEAVRGSCCHLPCASNPQLLLKITPKKRLRGRKASWPALSQNQDRMLGWNPEPPAAGPYMKTCVSCSGPLQTKLNTESKREAAPALALGHNRPKARVNRK